MTHADEARKAMHPLIKELEQWRTKYPCNRVCNPSDGPDEECPAHGRTPEDLWEIIGKMSEYQNAGAARIEELEATIQRVRDLHPPRPNSMSALYPTPLCACGKNYPCPTVLALEGGSDEV